MGGMKIDVLTRTGARILPDGLILPDDVAAWCTHASPTTFNNFLLLSPLAFQATVEDLKRAYSELKPRYYASRQRWTLRPRENQRSGDILTSGKRLSDYGIGDGSAIIFKDLGPQIGYRSVFFWEYLGPMLLYPLIYFLPAFVYPWASEIPPKTRAQSLACAYWVFHYAKREYETFFVHKFSHATMPLRNLFKNCMYYWSFAAYVSYFVNHPLYMPPSEMQTLLALAFALLCQLSNYRCHVILANLRPGGTGAYVIPRGFLFDYITCPNYTSEILGWVSFAVATQAAPAAAFALVGAAQMAAWAAGKHARLRKTFDGRDGREKYPKRWIMLPPFF